MSPTLDWATPRDDDSVQERTKSAAEQLDVTAVTGDTGCRYRYLSCC